MITSATNGGAVNGASHRRSRPSPASIHDRQHPPIIFLISWRRRPIAPWNSVSIFGISFGLCTMKDISSAGSPPILKNSRPCCLTKSRKIRCVARRTRWPCCFKAFPRTIKGWTSPRDPTTCMTMLSLTGNLRSSGTGNERRVISGFWLARQSKKPATSGSSSSRFMSSRPLAWKCQKANGTMSSDWGNTGDASLSFTAMACESGMFRPPGFTSSCAGEWDLPAGAKRRLFRGHVVIWLLSLHSNMKPAKTTQEE